MEPPTRPGPSIRPSLPDATIDAAARSFYKEAVGYGFALGDFLRFTNALLGIAMTPPSGQRSASIPPPPGEPDRRYHELPLIGRRVTVRRFGEAGDMDALRVWVDDAEGRFFLLSTASGQTHDVDELVKSEHNLVGMVLVDGAPVGCVAYLDYDSAQRRAELRKLIGDPALRGRGLGREAAKLWVGYGLGALGLQKIYLNTLVTHIANVKINEEIGFRVEGMLRNEVLIDGEPRDVLRMGMWRER